MVNTKIFVTYYLDFLPPWITLEIIIKSSLHLPKKFYLTTEIFGLKMYLWYFIMYMLGKVQWEEWNHNRMEEKKLVPYNEANIVRSGQFLKQLRTGARYTRQQLASIIGVSTDSLAGYEKGERLPPAEAIYILSQLFDVTFEEYLVGERDSEYEIIQ